MVDLIGDSLRNALCEQIAHEFYNANLYLFICAFLRNKGLDNLAKHFEGQQQEEMGHGMEFLNLLTDLNAQVTIPEIEGVGIGIDSIMDIATLYLNREILTTKSIYELKTMAMADNNSIVEEKMREMISKQQHEYAEATTFLDNASLCGDDWWKVKVWNDSCGG